MQVIALILLMSLPSHAFSKKVAVPAPIPSPSTPAYEPAPIDPTLRFVPQNYYATAAEQKMILAAGKLAVDTLKSKCFRDFLVQRPMIQMGGRTAIQVADHLQGLTGAVPVEMYTRCMSFSLLRCPVPTSAVAYRNPGSPTIHLNRVAFNEATPLAEWAGTMAHEGFGHALGGYEHEFYWDPMRDFSVPYSISGSSKKNGDAFQRCLPH